MPPAPRLTARDEPPPGRANSRRKSGACRRQAYASRNPRPGPRRAHAKPGRQDGPLQTVDTLYVGTRVVPSSTSSTSSWRGPGPTPHIRRRVAQHLVTSLARFASLSVTLCSSFHATTFFPPVRRPDRWSGARHRAYQSPCAPVPRDDILLPVRRPGRWSERVTELISHLVLFVPPGDLPPT